MSLRFSCGLLFVVSSLVACQPTYSELEVNPPLAVATVPFDIRYSRSVSEWCDTKNKINPCRSGSEPLELVSMTCDLPGCVLEKRDSGTVRATAPQSGTGTFTIEVRGKDSGDVLTRTVALEVLAIEDVDATLTVSVSTAAKYDGLCVGCGAWVSTELVERGAERPLPSIADLVQWTVTGGEIVERELKQAAGTKLVTVEARHSADVIARQELPVLVEADAVRSVVVPAYSLVDDSTEPTELEVVDDVELAVALVDAEGRRFPGGGERLGIDGAGCTIERAEDYSLHEVDVFNLVRATVPDGAVCTLSITDATQVRSIRLIGAPVK